MHRMSRCLQSKSPDPRSDITGELLLGNYGGGGYRDRQSGPDGSYSAFHTLPLLESLRP